jgi:NAD(P)-dependent dehydrogenase (short-subunit alcohol dehydrogenase family)
VESLNREEIPFRNNPASRPGGGVLMKLKDRVAIVTGAGSGIGEAIAMLFAREGAKVAVVDVDREKGGRTVEKIRSAHGNAYFVAADVSKEREAEVAVQKVKALFGPIHILINNAGIAHSPASILDLSEEVWNRVFSVNLTGQFLFLQKVAREMVEDRISGAAVNLTSGVLTKVNRHRSAYCTSKAAIATLTKTAALDLAPYGIRVNAIAPGMIVTPMTAKYQTIQTEDAEYMRAWSSVTPMGRWGQPEEIAATALFLASDDASYITGSILCVDGGFTIT